MTQLLSILLTNSRLKCFRACARLHQFMYLDGYRPAEDKAELAFGSLLHRGLEAWWKAVMAKLPEVDWEAVALDALHAVEDVDPFDLVKAEVLLQGYHERWRLDAALYEVLGVEQRFEFPLINPETGGRSPSWKVGGKLDVRLRRKSDGTTGFMEHKSSGEDVSLGSAYWQVLKLDSQVSTYFDGASSLGDDAQWCVYDVLGKPGQRPLKATPDASRKYTAKGLLYANQRDVDETPEEYRARIIEAMMERPERFYTRGEVVRLDGELHESRTEIWQQAAAMRESINAGRFVRNSDNCRRGNSLCPFFGVCGGQSSLEDGNLFHRTDDVHPELGGEPNPSDSPKEGL